MRAACWLCGGVAIRRIKHSNQLNGRPLPCSISENFSTRNYEVRNRIRTFETKNVCLPNVSWLEPYRFLPERLSNVTSLSTHVRNHDTQVTDLCRVELLAAADEPVEPLKSVTLSAEMEHTQGSFIYTYCIQSAKTTTVGRDSSVGIAKRYGMGGTGIKSRWRRDFPRPSW
jgi:hypothetical protein